MLLLLWNRQSIISYIPQIYHLRFWHVGITYLAFHMPCFLSWGMGDCKSSLPHACFFAMGHAGVAKRTFRMPAFLLWGMRELQNAHPTCLIFHHGACGNRILCISHACFSILGHVKAIKHTFRMPSLLPWSSVSQWGCRFR